MRTKPKFKIGQTVYDIGEDVTFKITNRLFDPSDGWIYQPGVGLVEWRFESDLRTRKPRKKTMQSNALSVGAHGLEIGGMPYLEAASK